MLFQDAINDVTILLTILRPMYMRRHLPAHLPQTPLKLIKWLLLYNLVAQAISQLFPFRNFLTFIPFSLTTKEFYHAMQPFFCFSKLCRFRILRTHNPAAKTSTMCNVFIGNFLSENNTVLMH